MTQQSLEVTGMSCGGCEQNVEDVLSNLAGVTSVAADHEADTVELTTEDGVDEAAIQEAIESAGYSVSA